MSDWVFFHVNVAPNVVFALTEKPVGALGLVRSATVCDSFQEPVLPYVAILRELTLPFALTLFVHGLALICEPDHPGDAASLPNTATSTFVCVAGACAVECVSYARLSLVPFDDVYDVSVGVACVAQVASK